jgi:tetraprenyl-beta-curcumene synthase
MRGSGRTLTGAIGAFGVYTSTILPRIARDREHWLGRAARIPDPVLRAQALGALTEKAANVDATGVFATLAPRRHRPAVVSAGVALQVAVDYLDTLGEDPGDDALADGMRLQRALTAAVTPGARPDDPYRDHPHRGDGGYLEELTAACARASATLPRIGECRARLLVALARCGEGQAYTHAVAGRDPAPLRRWADGLAVPPAGAVTWWEVAAGASSSVAAHALLALAAAERTTAADAERVDGAYFPSVGALSVLLDDLVDLDEDVAVGEHNYVSYCPDDRGFAERVTALADTAQAALATLPRRGRHEAILAGVAGFYMAQPAARAPRWTVTRRRLLGSLGAPARALTAFSRLRERG